MASLARSIGLASGSPALFRAALRREGSALRAAARRPPVNSLGTPLNATLMGDELIATLSSRLARTLRWWIAPATPEQAEAGSRRHDLVTAATDARSNANRDGSLAATASAARSRDDGAFALPDARRWNAPNVPHHPDNARRAATEPPQLAHSPAEFAHVNPTASAARAATLAQTHGYALGSGVQQRERHDRSSPLDIALRRYWQSVDRQSGIDAGSQNGAAASIATHASRLPERIHPSPAPAASRATGSDDTASRNGTPAGATPPSLGDGERPWWSARVDAIHARAESPVPLPPRAGAPRFEDDLPDESVFADALAEVLRQQARAYGVDVV